MIKNLNLFKLSFNWRFLLLLIPLIITLCFPTSNSTQDGYGFAAGARWNHDIFESHHLLYTIQLYLFSKLFLVNDTLLLGKILNAVYLFLCIFVLYKCLRLLTIAEKDSYYYSFLSGCFFSSLRFSTENETYIIPIVFSLLGTFFYLRFKIKQIISTLVLSGLFLAAACLFHQIQFFWWLVLSLSLLSNLKKIGLKPFLAYSIPAIVVPISYALVIVYYLQNELNISNFLYYLFQTFYTGTASISVSYITFFRWWISMLRTIIQIHPTILVLIKTKTIYMILLIINFGLLSSVLIWFANVNRGFSLKFNPTNKLFTTIIVLNLTYSLLGGGNSEFMVMIPFLFVLIFATGLQIPLKGIVPLGLTILLWNISLGIFPAHKYNFFPYREWISLIQNDKRSQYLMYDAVEISNIIYYQTGYYPMNCMPIKDVDYLDIVLDSLLNTNTRIFTNYLSEPVIKNSEYYLRDNRLKTMFSNFSFHISDSVEIFNKREYLFEIKKGHQKL